MSDINKYRPLGDKIVVIADDAEEKTKGGIYLAPDSQEKPQQGTVISVGEGKLMQDGTLVPLSIKPGEKVVYQKYGGSDHKTAEGVKFMIMREQDVLLVIDP